MERTTHGTRSIGANEKGTGRSISKGDHYFSVHLSNFHDKISPNDQIIFREKIGKALGEEISLREIKNNREIKK
ncbi:MAG: hypothetical protein ACFFD7_01305, partial [Candidatus Thorarchaeota archaeon]